MASALQVVAGAIQAMISVIQDVTIAVLVVINAVLVVINVVRDATNVISIRIKKMTNMNTQRDLKGIPVTPMPPSYKKGINTISWIKNPPR
ncbi:hypothetical protein [Virgibacillus saliphilus]|uniref:hypothetical protein n=1 Tax=Virgibacillus saliphilus TaxID=2831674 RepID=UPI00210805AC|nr:hypothetical protein [Virgibacillus sp. NKC19-3]